MLKRTTITTTVKEEEDEEEENEEYLVMILQRTLLGVYFSFSTVFIRHTEIITHHYVECVTHVRTNTQIRIQREMCVNR